jgi:hypothetical protein
MSYNIGGLRGKYYKKILILSILLAAHISCFIVLAFHAFDLAGNIGKLILRHKKLLKKCSQRPLGSYKERFPG